MNKEYLDFANSLKNEENIFICGPQFKDSHIRVYAYGGLLCQLPTKPGSRLKLFNLDYIKYAGESRQKLETAFGVELQATTRKEEESHYRFRDQTPNEGEKFRLLRDNLRLVLNAMKGRYSNEKNESKERQQQIAIARRYARVLPNRVIVCDIESSIPRSSLDPCNKGFKKGSAKFDLVTFKPGTAHGKPGLSIIELKSNRAACTNGSGLKTHSEDMSRCMEKGTADIYKLEILRRLLTMYQQFPDILEGSDTDIEHLMKNPADVDLCAGFLFVKGTGLGNVRTAKKLCEEFIDENKHHEFCYQFANDLEEVDLTAMQDWDSFGG